MARLKPRLAGSAPSKFKLKATLQDSVSNNQPTRFALRWTNYHDKMQSLLRKTGTDPGGKDADGAAMENGALDARCKAINGCSVWNDIEAPGGKDQVSIAVDSCAQPSKFSDNTAREIYACIRAEYKYLSEGYKKLGSRVTGNNGIDHIFVKGSGNSTRVIIVESKTLGDIGWLIRNAGDINAVVTKLNKKGRIVFKDNDYVIYCTQMDDEWIDLCIDQIKNEADNPSELRTIAEMVKSGSVVPELVVNVYCGLNKGVEEAFNRLVKASKKYYEGLSPEEQARIAEDVKASEMHDTQVAKKYDLPPGVYSYRGYKTQQILKVGDHNWVDVNPEKPYFYLLPGYYKLTAHAENILPGIESEAGKVIFADKEFKNEEFFYIERFSKRNVYTIDSEGNESAISDSGSINEALNRAL
jgi:hypothetical protein